MNQGYSLNLNRAALHEISSHYALRGTNVLGTSYLIKPKNTNKIDIGESRYLIVYVGITIVRIIVFSIARVSLNTEE